MIYTKKGDNGMTDILGNKRVSKCDKRICAMGAISQVYSYIEAAMVFLKDDTPEIKSQLENIFFTLLNCCHDLALDANFTEQYKISKKDIEFLENSIDGLENELDPIKGFIRIGLCEASAHLNIAMTTTRWAEREAVANFETTPSSNKNVIIYLNRLSDYLFCAARYINKIKGLKEA